ncbi:phosphonoacetate hydrolase [Sulfurivirga caldicuralii]|uniref:Phosphonoacetate hydrolase n=1 Tax=Sulfurivirga caldicuralii TaxID=364032 RepID=A0A1N6GI13_9GAMM|nr:alkylphosphonate utilization protein [Sulfurivirga caldicuralii]SIO07101.1 phosphonoacetate hydrolase [Sulfurivirga caldicuralii]
MSVKNALMERAGGKCELCGATENLSAVALEPSDGSADQSILVCDSCKGMLEGGELDANHLRCLNESAWSQEPAVQVAAWRLLSRLAAEGETWAQDLLDMLYLEEDVKTWAQAGLADEGEDEPTLKDANGNILRNGDSVILVKDLDVKGAGFTAKRGTQVKNIRITDDGKHFEGKVNGTSIYIVAAYTKKA